MPGIRLPANREELEKATAEIMLAGKRSLHGDDYENRPPERKKRPQPHEYVVEPSWIVMQWLEELSVLGAVHENELQQRADRVLTRWPAEFKALTGRDIVRILVRRKWARAAS